MQEGSGVIVYNLRCRNAHEFEGWFRDSAAYEVQARDGSLTCPVCESRKVEKAIMAPAVAGAKKQGADEARKMRQFMTGLRQYVQQNADYVGRISPKRRARSITARPTTATSTARPP